MKKLPVLASLTFFFTFLGIFIYSYKSSGKFRQSIASALLAALVLFSWPLESQAKDADAFTTQNQPRQSRPQHDRGIFGRKSKNDGSGPGKPDDFDSDSGGDGLPQFPQTESVEKTEERVENIETLIRQMDESSDTESECQSAEQLQKEVSDSDTENEEDQCRPESKAGFEYKVYKEMSSTLSKVSTNVRKDKETSKSLDKLEEQLKNGEFHAGRGAKKLPGTQTVYYMRAGNKARLFFKYSDKENGAVEVIAESNKDKEQQVIDNLKQNYE